MTDLPNAPPSTARGPAESSTSTGLEPQVAGLLTYLFGWISGLVFFLIEKKHREVRFHAAQSILLSVALLVVWIAISILSFLPYVGFVFSIAGLFLGLASFALWIFLLIQGYQLKHFKLPVIGNMAEQWAAK